MIADLAIENHTAIIETVAMQSSSQPHDVLSNIRVNADNQCGESQALITGTKNEAEALRARSKNFAIRVVKLFKALPRRQDAYVIGKQLLRSGTSVAANYRAVCRARSRAEFVAKMGVVVEETDETLFWLEIMAETEIIPAERLAALSTEAGELLRIFSASRKTAAQSGKSEA